MNNTKAKVGIIIDDAKQSKQIHDLIQLSKTSDFYEVSLLVIQKKTYNNLTLKEKIFELIQKHGIKKLILKAISRIISKVSFKLLLRYERSIIKKNPLFKNIYETYDLNDINIEKLYVTPNISKSGIVYKYTEEDLNLSLIHI